MKNELKWRIKNSLKKDQKKKRSYLEIDARVDGKRVHHIRRYNKNNKQEAFEQLSEIQQKCIKELTIDWNQKNEKGLIESKDEDKITDLGDFSQK